MTTITVKVQEIHCQACERTITAALGRMPGVRKVSPDRKTNQVRVLFDDGSLSEGQLRHRLADVGYPPV